ncbi:coiled-coil domain-containing protein 81-like isoform X2 [Parambassis ranga]|uniref:Coiled-coil domain-containing protein 81-like isoform X2 n=1 Tax=Parambassis ranga TaxID=210632 RepID=A0A6P7I635_9TELE|nr:coiled-coil domain-containing protein 81 isoform X2 [Parambassis ranga]
MIFPEMTDILQLVSEEENRTSACLSKNDIDSIWTEVSAYIERQMTLQRGVHLAGLGTFTFSQQKLDIGNKFIMIQRPIFILSGKLVHTLGLKQTRPLAAATHLPVVQLNFAAVSQETPFSRDTVEGCVKETLLLLYRALASEKNTFLTFKGIGVLFFKKNKVQMKFNRDFINAMDGTGQLLFAFNKRSGSSVSLLSGGLSKLQRPQTANPVTLPTVCSPQPDSKAADKDVHCLSAAPDPRNAGVPQQRESKSHQTLLPAKLKAVSLFEELNPNPPPLEATDKHTPCNSSQDGPSKVVEHFTNMSCSGHTRAGQELCYLCMQRARRNVPVYLREQQQADERAQEKLLLLNEQLRDKQYMEEEQVRLNEQREHAKQVAAFNLQMSGRNENTHAYAYPNSFIFPARPVTPHRRIQQNRYMNDLQGQIESRRKHEAQDQQNRLLMECLDQVQLTQEIALQKAQLLQQKQQKTSHYKRALDTQVGDKKCTEPPESQPDSSRFTRCEVATSRAASREKAQELFQVNFSAATQRKKEELHTRQQQLQKEMEMLRYNKMELIMDRINRFEKMRDINKSLGDEWSRSATLKHKREEDERRFLRSAGQLLVDKLAEYKRCCQCKRRTTNCGRTNIWKDSHYVSGSQFMI